MEFLSKPDKYDAWDVNTGAAKKPLADYATITRDPVTHTQFGVRLWMKCARDLVNLS